MPDVLKAQSNDIMGRIEQIAACGIPRELLILLSSGLFEAGKAAQRAGAPIGKLADWCHECVLAGTTSVEQMISFGMPSETMAELANALADIGRHAEPRGVNEKLAELAFDFVLAGRRAEQVASAVSLSEKWKLQRTAA
jgi:hypothetical protein